MGRYAMKRSRPLRRRPLAPSETLPSRAPLQRTTPPLVRTPLRRVTPLARSALAAASPAQRAKVAGSSCLVCGARVVDPAHLVPRSLGGCDDAACVALCRRHHRAYDRGELDLLPYLEPDSRIEICHAVGHLGILGALRRLTGQRNHP